MVLLCRPQLTKEALSISASYFSWLSSLTPANQQHKTEKLTGISTYTTLSPPYSLNIWVFFFLCSYYYYHGSCFVAISCRVEPYSASCTESPFRPHLRHHHLNSVFTYSRRGFINWSSVYVLCAVYTFLKDKSTYSLAVSRKILGKSVYPLLSVSLSPFMYIFQLVGYGWLPFYCSLIFPNHTIHFLYSLHPSPNL